MTETRNLAALARFAVELGSPWVSFGAWDKIGFRKSVFAERFVRHCYDDGWVLADFDWPTWMQSSEAQALRSPTAIRETASAEMLAMLLTVAVRQDRFVEGGLNGWRDDGLLVAICERAGQLSA